jgi:hypothetical protein
MAVRHPLAPEVTVPRRIALLLLAAAALAYAGAAGCAHKPRSGGADALRAASERFHLLLRWGDVRGAIQFVVPERRLALLKAALDAKDEESLRVTEYELEDAQFSDEKATVLSKITWYRIPSVVTRSEAVVTHWVSRDGAWMIEAIEGGPLVLPPASDAVRPRAKVD